MQPETKVKENGQAKQYTPAEQWDQLSFSVVANELAPKGFKEIRSGAYRGAVQANIPFLDKKTVTRTQKIAAQLVRGFRTKTQERLKAIIKDVDQWIADDDAKLKACRFWELRKKREFKDKLISLRGQAGSYHRLLQELENVGIK